MTKLHVHDLTGLRPDALATYLGALGILRLLAEQKDPQVRGFWRDEHFVLVSELDWATIERFLLEDYAPTPILAPWNMESGFFSWKSRPSGTHGNAENPEAVEADEAPESKSEEDEDDEDDDESEQAVGDSLLDRISGSEAARFALLRRAIETAQAAIPTDLRNAEEVVRRAHDAVNERTAEERAEHEAALRELAATEEDLAQRKAAVEEKKRSAKGTAKTAPERDALSAAEQQMKDATGQQKLRKKRAKDLEKKLKAAQKEAKGDKTLKKAIADAKKHFKDIQGATKDRLVGNLRARWSPEGQQWVDAAIALDENGEAGFTSIFGSGGNDGRMEFTKNLRVHLDLLFDIDTGAAKDDAAPRLNAAIRGTPTNLLVSRPVGQFFPGRAGGTNMGAGFSGGAAINPWEFVLMLEGAVVLVAGMSRRGDAKARVSSPFWVQGASAGFGSASDREGNPRGEQWLPLWSRPLCYRELVELIREGRAQVGRRQTTTAGDLVRATARLGLARGVDSLQRFAYLQRNGQSNLAVSTGRFYVTSRSHQALLDEVAPWIDRLGRYARRTKDNNVPLSLGAVARRTQEALFAVCRQEARPREWRDLLVLLGAAELALARSGKNPARRPLPRLSGEWIAAVDDGTPRGRTSLRLALALASQHRPSAQVSALPTDSVRKHFIPVDAGNQQHLRFKLDDRGRVIRDRDNVCVGRDLITDAIALVERRSVWARSASSDLERAPQLPLEATPGCEAALEEVAAWLRRDVPDQGVLELVRPLLALDWREVGRTGPAVHPELRAVPDPLHMLFRLAHLPFDVPVRGRDGSAEARVPVRLDPEPLRRLAAGDLEGALKVASRRLEASGLRPVFRRGVATPTLARRLAASLAFPISRNDAARASRLICKPYEVKDAEEASSTQF